MPIDSARDARKSQSLTFADAPTGIARPAGFAPQSEADAHHLSPLAPDSSHTNAVMNE